MSNELRERAKEARAAKNRCTHYAKAAIILAFLTALAFFIAMMIPPYGEVARSVLQGMGILAGLSASFKIGRASCRERVW